MKLSIFKAFQYMSVGVLSVGALPSGSSHRAPLEPLHLQNAVLLSVKVPGETNLPLSSAIGPL